MTLRRTGVDTRFGQAQLRIATPAVPVPQRDGSHLQAEWTRWRAWWPEDTPLPELSDQFAENLPGLGHPERSWMVDVTRHVLHEAAGLVTTFLDAWRGRCALGVGASLQRP